MYKVNYNCVTQTDWETNQSTKFSAECESIEECACIIAAYDAIYKERTLFNPTVLIEVRIWRDGACLYVHWEYPAGQEVYESWINTKAGRLYCRFEFEDIVLDTFEQAEQREAELWNKQTTEYIRYMKSRNQFLKGGREAV